MFKYLRHSDMAFRLNLNPFNWEWKPFFSIEAPTPFFPKRTTYAIGWLFIQIFVDVDNGTRDFKSYQAAFMNAFSEEVIEVDDEHEVGSKVSTPGKRSSILE